MKNGETIKEKVGPQNITDFIREYNFLLSALGIFAALAVFSGNLPYKWISSILSFFFFAVMILVWFEVRKKFSKTASFTFTLFQDILNWGFLILVLYWLIAFRLIWNLAMPFPLALLISFGLTTLLKKIGIREKVGKKIWLVIVVGMIISVLYVASIIAVPINQFFNAISVISTKLDQLK